MKGLQKNDSMDFLNDKKIGAIETRINPEISKAIRRQKETTNGVEYWKTSSISKGTFPGAQKRTTFDKIHNLKFEFPNGILPAISSPSPRLQTMKSSCQTSKGSRKKAAPSGLEAMNRSYNSGLMNVPSVKDSGGHISPKKASVTDLTCLQLADTLLSHQDQMSPGLYGFSVGKIRYMDYLVESMKAREELERENSFYEHFPSVRMPFRDGRIFPLPIMTGGDTDRTVDLRTGEFLFQGESNYGKFSHGKKDFPVDSREVRPEDIIIVETTKNVKRRSILKPAKSNSPPADYLGSEKDKKTSNNDTSTCNEPSADDVVQPSANPCKYGSPFEPSQCITITSHPPRNGSGLTGCGISVLTSNTNGYISPNRSVRFSVSDEIHEYMPSEPIY